MSNSDDLSHIPFPPRFSVPSTSPLASTPSELVTTDISPSNVSSVAPFAFFSSCYTLLDPESHSILDTPAPSLSDPFSHFSTPPSAPSLHTGTRLPSDIITDHAAIARFHHAFTSLHANLPSSPTKTPRLDPLSVTSVTDSAPSSPSKQLRPPVPADQRLAQWHTPFSLHQRSLADLGFIPPEAVDKTYALVFSALELNTRRTYGAGILRFNQYCDAQGIPEDVRMPASQELVGAFVADVAGSVSGSTIRSWLSGLRCWHILNKAPWPDSEFLSLLRSASTKLGVSHKKSARAPISLEHLEVLRSALTLSKPHHAALWACALVTFFACRRLGETTIKSVTSFDPNRNVTRGSPIHFKRNDSNSLSSAHFFIPWTKTTKTDGASVVITARSDLLCPVIALSNHLHVNSSVPPSAPLFAYSNTAIAKGYSCITKSNMLTFTKKIWDKDSSLAHVSGHSYRIGGAVTLLLAGVKPEVVAAAGGWTSLAFLLYWRKVDQIIPLHTSQAYDADSLAVARSSINSFRLKENISEDMLSE